MLDLTTARAPFRPPWPQQPSGSVTLSIAPLARRCVVRGEAACVPAGRAFGLELPRTPLQVARLGTKAALWLGPDEWLLIDESEMQSAEGFASIRATLTGTAASVVDVSERQIGLRVAGANAAQLLNVFVPIDLALLVFPIDAAARTIFEKSEIVLWRQAETVFHIEVWRSFAPYVSELMTTVQAELAAT